MNKGLGFRGAKVFFEDYKKELPDLIIDAVAPIHNVAFVAGKIFPWAEFEYVEPISNGSGEVERHILRLELNTYGKQFLILERFYAGSLNPPQFPEPMEDEDVELSPSDFHYDEPDE